MEGPEVTVEEVTLDDVQWHFGDGQPRYRGWPIDPFPAYPHDVKIARATLAKLGSDWPARTPLAVQVASFETVSRTNGYTTPSTAWDEGARRHVLAGVTMFLSGKRIPPHPALTRYVVAHEYGRAVESWLDHLCGWEDGRTLEEYARLRGLEEASLFRAYGGEWHRSAAEIFADDFRLEAGVETEYWPHPGIPRLDVGDDAWFWWAEARGVLRWATR